MAKENGKHRGEKKEGWKGWRRGGEKEVKKGGRKEGKERRKRRKVGLIILQTSLKMKWQTARSCLKPMVVPQGSVRVFGMREFDDDDDDDEEVFH